MGNHLTQKEKIRFILSDYQFHGRGEFIYTHYLPKHDSRISEMIGAGEHIEKKMMTSTLGRFEMHYRIVRPEPTQERLFVPLTHYN